MKHVALLQTIYTYTVIQVTQISRYRFKGYSARKNIQIYTLHIPHLFCNEKCAGYAYTVHYQYIYI